MSRSKSTLNELLDNVATDHADSEAIVTARERLTYAELHDRVVEFARGLLSLGVRKGDRVGVLISNRAEWFVATYAVEQVGGTMVGLNTWYTPDELRYALRKADVSTLVTVDSFLGNDYLDMLAEIDPVVRESDGTGIDSTVLPVLQNIVVAGETPPWAISWTDVASRAERVSSERLDAISEEVCPSDDAYILFSSGTTGRPKPIVLRHDGLVTNPRSIGSRIGASSDDRFWIGLPLFFSFAACNQSITALSHGATLVVQEKFDPETALNLIQEESCTVMYGMGNMYKQMEDLDENLVAAFESVRIGLAIAPRPIRERLETEYGIDSVLHCYGLTETSAICTTTHYKSAFDERMETAGRPLANVDIRIKDPESDMEVTPGEEGEICIRSRAMFREYLKLPEKTADSFDGDSYFRTGDIGRLDADGRLIFEGRMKDMIKTGGINVSPQDVQRVIDQHPDVNESVVVGVPEEEKGEIIAAVVRPVSGSSLSDKDVLAFCKGRMAAYKIPEVVAIRESTFPRTDTGKIKKFKIRKEFGDVDE